MGETLMVNIFGQCEMITWLSCLPKCVCCALKLPLDSGFRGAISVVYYSLGISAFHSSLCRLASDYRAWVDGLASRGWEGGQARTESRRPAKRVTAV